LTKRAKGNIDYVQGILFPTQTYAFSGRQWGGSQAASAGKKATDASPMVITSQPPGAFAKDDAGWKLTFGSSHDGWLTLFNSAFMANSPPTLNEGDAWGKGFLHATEFNLFKLVNDIQQITYIANKNTVQEFRDSPKIVNEFSARGLGLRLPQMTAGYGKTVALRPTDPEPQDARLNDPEHKLARETWKHGPLLVPWDSRVGGWNAFNYLITGQHKGDLGTLVHGSNADENEGFPFLKGKITDVWWVRKTLPQAGVTGKDSDFEKSGEVLTHLEHRWYDQITKTVAALNTIFTIPGPNHAACHGAPAGPTTCGEEETYDGVAIDLKTAVHFNMEGTDKDGPLNFTIQDISPNLICSSVEGFFHPVTIYFNDEGCVWDAAVKIDECDLAGGHFANLAANDVALAERMTYFCNFITSWGGGGGGVKIHQGFDLPTTININNGSTAASLACLESNIYAAYTQMGANTLNVGSQVFNAAADYSEYLANAVIAHVNAWITNSLLPVILACCGEGASLSTIIPEFASPTTPAITIVPPELLECAPSYYPAPTLNCEYCFGVHLNVPCGEKKSVFAGDACFTNEPPTPTTAYGDCQYHD
jgi:hypothetical protein